LTVLLAEVEAANLLPIDVDSLFLGGSCPCDLFRRLQGGEYVLFAAQGHEFDGDSRIRLKQFGTEVLYIRREAATSYSRFLKESLTRLIRNPSISAAAKAQAVQVACREVLRRICEEPRAAFVSQASEIIAPTVELIVASDEAARHLVRLTSFDHATYVHSTNVGIFALALARLFFGADPQHDLHRLGAGFFLHDLGKCLVPLEILNKPGALTAAERQIMNRHVEDGFRLLEESHMLTDEVRTIVLQHHERDNGSGYPYGMTGPDIHPYARICRLADIYEALTSNRPYHTRRSTFEALKFMRETVVADVDEQLFGHFVRLFM